MLPTRSPDRSFSLPDSKQNDDVGFEVTTGLSLYAIDHSKRPRWTRLVIMIRTLTDLGTCYRYQHLHPDWPRIAIRLIEQHATR
jgi:hypothetical protein